MMAPKNQIGFWNGSALSLINIPDAGLAWHHLAVVFDAGAWNIYWDGELAGTGIELFGNQPESPTQIGSSTPSPTSEGWIGLLDEIAFYRDALPLTSIRNHYQALTGAAKSTRLIYARAGQQLTLFWDTDVTGYVLEFANTLSSSGWAPVTGITNNSYTINVNKGAGFYRLQKP